MNTNDLPQISSLEEKFIRVSFCWRDDLTIRQQEIFLAHGYYETVGMSYRQMALHLSIPYNTLKAHLFEIRRKLDIQSRPELTYHACLISLQSGGRYDKT